MKVCPAQMTEQFEAVDDRNSADFSDDVIRRIFAFVLGRANYNVSDCVEVPLP